MKLLVIFFGGLAVATASYPYYYDQHIPTINIHGVPVDTPAVQIAKAAHAAAHAAAQHNAGGSYADHGIIQLTADGIPVDAPDVQLMKAAHAVAYNRAVIRNSIGPYHGYSHVGAGYYRKRRSLGYGYPQHIPVIGPNGVPVETPEVQAAKKQHYDAIAQAQSLNSLAPTDNYSHDEHRVWSGPYHIPVIGPNGVPVETPEVQAAKAQHLAAYGKVHNTYPGPHYQGHYGYH